jgi:alanine racemase
MGRLGFDYSRAATAVEKISLLRGIEIAGLYSHFTTSEDPDQSYARLQIERFRHVVEELERRKIDVGLCHMANSGAIIAHADAHFDMVRPGIMLYGYPPGHGMPEKYPVRPVMALRSIVSFVKTVEPGSSISYGRRYVAHRRTQIATVPVGYADGFSRSLTNRASVIIRGVRYPQVGTVCMDHIMVDTGADGRVSEGDPVTLMGSEGNQSITAWDIGETIGTIPYEVTSLISARVPRIFLDKPGSGPG